MFTTAPRNLQIIAALENLIAENTVNGTIIPYATLDSTAGFPIRERRYLLDAARAKAEKRCFCVFLTVRDVGLQRYPIDESWTLADSRLKNVRRGTKKDSKRLINACRNNKMSGEARQLTTLKAAHLELLRAQANPGKTEFLVPPVTADMEAARRAAKNL